MEVPMILCAESAAVDQRKNTLSAFHIVEEIPAPSFPFLVLRIYIIALFVREIDEPLEQVAIQFRIYLDDSELARVPVDIRFQGHTRVRLISEVQGIVVEKPGLLKFVALHEDKPLASWTVPVRLVGRQEPQMDMPFLAPAETTNPA